MADDCVEKLIPVPFFALDVEHHGIRCKHCGVLLHTMTELGGWVGEDGAYWCEDNPTLGETVWHEPAEQGEGGRK